MASFGGGEGVFKLGHLRQAAHKLAARLLERWFWVFLRFGQAIVICCPILVLAYFNRLMEQMSHNKDVREPIDE